MQDCEAACQVHPVSSTESGMLEQAWKGSRFNSSNQEAESTVKEPCRGESVQQRMSWRLSTSGFARVGVA